MVARLRHFKYIDTHFRVNIVDMSVSLSEINSFQT